MQRTLYDSHLDSAAGGEDIDQSTHCHTCKGLYDSHLDSAAGGEDIDQSTHCHTCKGLSMTLTWIVQQVVKI